ncbi:hypothetical protein [Bacteroidetes bacterium endosymbiont of Geopemphigus sp.]|uniref:hypothetical protein n=1 Tax=Bacteroidetes bacterium endosymbiont of Geopemphigus sp. TaxID=2047937 RepID=UPI0011AED14E|nr:hypothetical protein [Bacteroidetes bacterium endosymbiont of Geopemphigus sp.]
METLKLSTELTGLSEGGRFFKFCHNSYKEIGQYAALSEILDAWTNLNYRKLLSDVSNILLEAMNHLPRFEDFRMHLPKKIPDLLNIRPKDLKIEPYV